jgi:multidrug transporter EmrE-like cation transporter
LILISIGAGVAGQAALKSGVGQAGTAVDGGLENLLRTIAMTPLVWLGLACYAGGALAWIAVLQRMDLGYAYPFLALNFVLVALVSMLVLGEPAPAMRWVGIGLIVAGILVVARAGT